jgi:hypothetical protein
VDGAGLFALPDGDEGEEDQNGALGDDRQNLRHGEALSCDRSEHKQVTVFITRILSLA